MTLRTTSSSCTFAAGAAAGTVVKSTITQSELLKLIASPHTATPVALTEGSGVATPSELKVTRVLIRSVDDPEMLVRVYQGDPIQIDAAMGAWARNVTRVGVVSNKAFNPDHGLELEYTYENVGGAVYNSVTAWDLQNTISDFALERANLIAKLVGVTDLVPVQALPGFARVAGALTGTPGPPIPSDERLKTDIEDSPIKKYAKLGLRDVTWAWNAVAKNLFGLAGQATGVVAQEVEGLYPFAVEKDAQGYRHVRYALLDAMVAAV